MRHQNICVLGGTGFVGSYLVSRLAAAGRTVKVLTRRREQGKALILLPGVSVVEADIHDEPTLVREFSGVDAVINLVGILHESRRGREDLPAARRGDFERVHVELPRKVVHACGKAGVRRLLHMSALGADPLSKSAYQRSKGIGEVLVREAAMPHSEDENAYLNGPKFIHGQGMRVTIFRPSVIFGRGDSFLTMFARLQKYLPVLVLASPQARFAPVYVDDVARAFADSLDELATYGKTYELCGPKVYTLYELVRYVGEVTGHRRPVIALGDRLSYLLAWLMECLPGPKIMTRDNYYAMQVDNVCKAGWPDVFAFEPTALEAVAPDYLQVVSPRARFDGYRARARRPAG